MPQPPSLPPFPTLSSPFRRFSSLFLPSNLTVQRVLLSCIRCARLSAFLCLPLPPPGTRVRWRTQPDAARLIVDDDDAASPPAVAPRSIMLFPCQPLPRLLLHLCQIDRLFMCLMTVIAADPPPPPLSSGNGPVSVTSFLSSS